MDLFRSYKYRIYPNKAQLEVIKNTQGCCKFVYNLLWGTIHDRDHNAALNIRNEAMRIFTEYGARASTHDVVYGSIE